MRFIFDRSTFLLGDGFLESKTDIALIRHTLFRRPGLDGIQQVLRQAHVHARGLRLKLEVHRNHYGEIVFGQIGGFDEMLCFLIGPQDWKFF